MVPRLSKDGSVHVTDEVFNTASHTFGAIFALLGSVLLIVQASVAATPWHIVGFSIYGATLVFLFISSALHHGLDGSPRFEQNLKIMDYVAIFLLIAGTYTPMSLVPLHGPLGWSLLGVVWATAIVGITLKAARPALPGRFGFHEIWHITVLLGAFCHYLLMLLVVLPLGI